VSTVLKSIALVFSGARKAFRDYPVVIAAAFAFALVAIVRIQLDWTQQAAVDALFKSLHWALALGAAAGMAFLTAARGYWPGRRGLLIANLAAAAAALLAFLLLYVVGCSAPVPGLSVFKTLSLIAQYRMGVAILLCSLTFLLLSARPKEQSDIPRAFFMMHKALFTAVLYGGVLMAGLSSVAGALQALVYNAMSWKVYGHLGALCGFLAFTIFVGYFPDFAHGQLDPKRAVGQQPRVVQVLLEYILVPVVLALSLVLLLWAGRSLLGGQRASFMQLSSITATYTLGGIWLHFLVSHGESGLASLYRKLFPLTALVVLAFEGWAIFSQLGFTGLRDTEYFICLIWLFSLAAAVLLLLLKDRAYLIIVALLGGMGLFSALPLLGYHALPVSVQSAALERLLGSQGLLRDSQLRPSSSTLDEDVRIRISSAVDYLASADTDRLPPWFNREWSSDLTFAAAFGFSKSEAKDQNMPQADRGSVHLTLAPVAVATDSYDWVLHLFTEQQLSALSLDGRRGRYRVQLSRNLAAALPVLSVQLGENLILEQGLQQLVDQAVAAYSPGTWKQVGLDELGFSLQTPELDLLLVLRALDKYRNPMNGRVDYWCEVEALYLSEKP